jgi:hypothetical protein
MRGNHRIWGRQDYTEPAPLGTAERGRIAECEVSLRDGLKTWFEVRYCGQLIGYVTTRCHGQDYRTLKDESWWPAAGDWNRSDPPHGHAILKLLQDVETKQLAA